ncbi:hypothetical protein A2797_02300 [candidate division WWE3 bacterium RIFCSPHIGHO2_01_FULL_48_15]|uniref:PsbP C-terminal domain-containing protein n=1 Tax=candidate division WWE3 bacterium RIFCSPHIGHO2_01_FULL_48_15 TaxID=1802619 RepID=A0A1F4VBS1_UNCKA|nr:MAG: hypothetical protein A2797_02300 [candidate division WWE3 bacterium RIFCSPHIGHO2_01_FULL_48_15]
MVYEVRRFSFSAISWKKISFGLLFVLATSVATAAGYTAVALWQRYLVPLEKTEDKYVGWQVYFNEQYALGLRYPEDWEVKEVAKEFVVFTFRGAEITTEQSEDSTKAPRDYITLEVKAAGDRPSTECENNQLSCSFYTNDIYGEKTANPESEIIFFTKGGNDFSFIFHKYGEAGFASSAEGGASKYGDADFSKIFEDMNQSLRFVTDETNTGSGS